MPADTVVDDQIEDAQVVAMIQAFVLMALTLTGAICGWQIVLLSVCAGLVTGFEVPARQSFVVQMVERREDLANAIALNSSMFNAARLIGPAIAGLLIRLLGEWPCFLINGLSYLAVLGSLAAMRSQARGNARTVNKECWKA